MSIESELSNICKDLKILEDKDLVRKALQAYAAVTDTERPQVDLSYSYIIRQLRKGSDERKLKFQKAFLKAFNEALYADIEEPAAVALMIGIKTINFKEDEGEEDA
jgi:hypothetical protein